MVVDVVVASYPAGFVYIFSLLYWLTDAGDNVRLAQYIFAGFYLVNIMLVFGIYYRVRKVLLSVLFALLVYCIFCIDF